MPAHPSIRDRGGHHRPHCRRHDTPGLRRSDRSRRARFGAAFGSKLLRRRAAAQDDSQRRSNVGRGKDARYLAVGVSRVSRIVGIQDAGVGRAAPASGCHGFLPAGRSPRAARRHHSGANLWLGGRRRRTGSNDPRSHPRLVRQSLDPTTISSGSRRSRASADDSHGSIHRARAAGTRAARCRRAENSSASSCSAVAGISGKRRTCGEPCTGGKPRTGGEPCSCCEPCTHRDHTAASRCKASHSMALVPPDCTAIFPRRIKLEQQPSARWRRLRLRLSLESNGLRV